jgi:HlyD family secretion protein
MLVETEPEPKAKNSGLMETQGAQKPNAGKKKPQQAVKYIVGGLIAAIFSLGIILYFVNTREKPVLISSAPVITKTITQIVSATGRIQPETEVIISPDVSGEIIALPIREGQSVTKGDLLFKINPELLNSQVDQQQASLSAARARSLQSKAQQLKADDDLRRTGELYSKQLISESDYTTAKTNAEVAKATYQASLFEISRVQSLLEQSREQLSRSTVFSPISGTITLLNNKLGERVVATSQFQGTEVLRIADLNSMEIEVEVNENDIIFVQQGDTARISVDAYRDKEFKGLVTEIANMATTSMVGTQDEATNFNVTIRILDHQRLLKPGMSATANIETETVENAVAVPLQSVTVRSASQLMPQSEKDQNQQTEVRNQNDDLKKIVFVLDDKKAVAREVKTGIADNTHIQIIEGLSTGDEVVSGSYRAISRDLKNGSNVKTSKD